MRFRTNLLLIPVVLICLGYLTRSIQCNRTLPEVVGFQGNDSDLIHLVVLGLCAVAALLFIKHGQGR